MLVPLLLTVRRWSDPTDPKTDHQLSSHGGRTNRQSQRMGDDELSHPALRLSKLSGLAEYSAPGFIKELSFTPVSRWITKSLSNGDKLFQGPTETGSRPRSGTRQWDLQNPFGFVINDKCRSVNVFSVRRTKRVRQRQERPFRMEDFDRLEALAACDLCEHRCRINPLKEQTGICGITTPVIASATLHPAPPESHTVFMAGCNFKYLNRQNWTISQYPDNGSSQRGYETPGIWHKMPGINSGSIGFL